jgi:uncharacterized protein
MAAPIGQGTPACGLDASIQLLGCIGSADDRSRRKDRAPLSGSRRQHAPHHELLDQGADVNAADAAGWTPLHFAAQDYRVDAVATLIAAGAEIDARNRFGATPLSVAVFNSMGRGEALQLLLDAGADPDCRNSAGISPRAGAEGIANYDVATYFEGR